MASILGHKRLATSFLVFNIAFSVHTIWYTLWRNGYIKALLDIWSDGPHVLPGSNNIILTKYTLIRPLDQLVTFSIVLFANVTDGSTPAFSIFAFHFTGQWAAVVTIVIMEGLREGNRGSIISQHTAWLLFMNCVTYGCGMPVYCLVHLWVSITAMTDEIGLRKQTAIKDADALRNLPLSIIIGYGLPTILMSIPFSNNQLHQWLGGAWQGHPLWICLVQLILRRRKRELLEPNELSVQLLDEKYLSRLRDRVYLCAFGFATVTHVASLAIVGTRAVFPMLFSEWAQDTITFQNTYQPSVFLINAPMDSLANAVFDFFKYDLYCGSVASTFWALNLYLSSRRMSLTLPKALSLFGRMLGLCIISGPAAVLVFLMWSRDEGDEPREPTK